MEAPPFLWLAPINKEREYTIKKPYLDFHNALATKQIKYTDNLQAAYELRQYHHNQWS